MDIFDKLNIIDRIFQLQKEKGMTQKTLSKYLGVTQSTLSDWKSKRLKPSFDDIEKIATIFDVPIYFLLTGYNDPSPSGSAPSPSPAAAAAPEVQLSTDESALVSLYRSLNVVSRARALTLIADMAAPNVLTPNIQNILNTVEPVPVYDFHTEKNTKQ